MKLFKQSITALIIITGLSVTGTADAASKPVVGIAEFKKSVAVNWWGGQVGKDMADMLANELMGTKKFNVVERQKLNAVIGEQKCGRPMRKYDQAAAGHNDWARGCLPLALPEVFGKR